MGVFKEIGEFLRSVQGIIIGAIAVITIVSSILLRHDAKVRNEFAEKHKSILLIDVDSIFRLRITPVTDSIKIVARNQRLLQNNYSNFVEANTSSFDEWKKYMNGLEFVVVNPSQEKSIAPEMKIKIQKIKK